MKKSWRDKYDVVNRSNDGDLVLFGEHYVRSNAERFLFQEGYTVEEVSNLDVYELGWVHFGLFRDDDGKAVSGWTWHEHYKKGMIEAVMFYESLEHQKKRNAGDKKC